MFARLTVGAAHLLDVSFQTSSSLLAAEDDCNSVVQVDLNALHSLVNPLPENTWRRIADVCQNSVSPVYKTLRTMVCDDIERMTQVLLELEHRDEQNDCWTSNVHNTDEPTSISLDSATSQVDFKKRGCLGQVTPRKSPKRRSFVGPSKDQPVVIPSSHPSAPTIVIIPCPSVPRETSCRIPYQNDGFGNMLTVPLHPTINKVHPPLMPMKGRSPTVSKWIWREGHWEAVIPSLEEQNQKGLFSRMYAEKRKISRARSMT